MDSPVYVTIRPQSVLDTGPIFPVEEFLPLTKCLPLLDSLAEQVQAPLVVVLMGWEHAGSWVYPELFSPVGGEEAMHESIRSLRARGWHAGSFCSGTRWVIGHTWNDYDGRDYFDDHQGETAVCRQADGSMWLDNWDMNWRPRYTCCIGLLQP